MNTLLKLIRWSDVRKEWDWLLPRVEEIRKRCSQDWRCEDVYAACLNNKAQLFVGIGEWHGKGFVVLQVVMNDYTLDNELFVWLANGDGGGIPALFMPELKTIAKEMGCKLIRFRSPRRWDALPGIKIRQFEYEIPLDEEVANV